jgi:anaerobic magnesium-protoporphyrin IX monomethyl ester cyclase
MQEQRPDWVGISVASKNNHLAQCVTSRLREALSVPIVWGGIDATFNPDIAIRHADVVCLGEADETILELNDALAGNGSPSAVKGIWYRENGEVRKNPVREAPRDLNRLPLPDYDLAGYALISADRVCRGEYHLSSNLRLGTWPVLTARGCPFRCSYCCHGTTDPGIPFTGRVRTRSPEHVLSELAWIQKHQRHVRELYVTDEVLGANLKWFRALVKAMDGKRPFRIASYVHPGTAKPSWIRLFRELGGEDVFMGIQSGSERVNREVFNRPTGRDEILDACRHLTGAGFHPLIEFIGRNPYQTEEDLREAVGLICELPRPFRVWMVYPLAFYRNFAITNRAFEDGLDLEPINQCTWEARQTPELRFQDAFVFFAALAGLSSATARTLLGDKLWRRMPEILDEINEVLKQSAYHFVRSDCCVPKDQHIARLERELATLWGSRMVRGYMSAKGKLMRLFGR